MGPEEKQDEKKEEEAVGVQARFYYRIIAIRCDMFAFSIWLMAYLSFIYPPANCNANENERVSIIESSE